MEVEINLGVLWKSFLKHLWAIILIALLVTLLVTVYTAWFVTPVYRATVEASVMINDMNQTQISNLNTTIALMGTYARLVTSDATMEEASRLVRNEYSASQIRSMVNVTYEQGGVILYISVSSVSPEHAATLANQVAVAAQETIDLAEMQITRSAVTPGSPTSPSLTKNILIAFVFSFAAAYLLFLLIDLYNNKIASEKQLANLLDLPVIGSIPAVDAAETQKR